MTGRWMTAGAEKRCGGGEEAGVKRRRRGGEKASPVRWMTTWRCPVDHISDISTSGDCVAMVTVSEVNALPVTSARIN